MKTTAAPLSQFGAQLEALETALKARTMTDVRSAHPLVEDTFGAGTAPLPQGLSPADESSMDPAGLHLQLVSGWKQLVQTNTQPALKRQGTNFLVHYYARSDRKLSESLYATIAAAQASPDLLVFAMEQNVFPRHAMQQLERDLGREFAHTFDSGTFPAIVAERGALWVAETDDIEADPHDDILFLNHWATAGANSTLIEGGNGYTRVEQWHVSNIAPQHFEDLLADISTLSLARPVFAAAYRLAMKHRCILEEFFARSPLSYRLKVMDMIVIEAGEIVKTGRSKGMFAEFIALLEHFREAEDAESPMDMI